MKTSNIPCWQCGKKLQLHHATGEIVYAEVQLSNCIVRVHKTCKPDALKALDMTPRRSETEPRQGHTPAPRMSDDL